ncbi:MAG: glycosyltransferase family 2 protein, partial [Hyphomicrobiales bacterium]|nr:glycosyltransferase family 2 protein [Hyphomicrobiales bacterium]
TRVLSQIAEVCKAGPSKVQFALQPVDGDGAPIGQVFPQLSADVTSADLIAAVLDNGCYTSPPTSGNVYRRDVWEVARTVDYETWTDGVVYLLCPFRGEVVSLPMALAEYRIHGRNDSTAPATGGRFQREADRFAKRLEHLRTLVSPEHAARLKPADQYFFFNERLVLDKSFGERSFGRQTILRTLRSLVGQRQSTGRMLFMMAWFLSLTVAPKRLRLKLASLRQKPLYSLRLLGMLKRLS